MHCKPFVTTFKTGDTQRQFIVRRTTRQRLPLEVLWTIPRQVNIPARWDCDKIVEQHVQVNWSRYMVRALDKALKTAK